MKYKRNRYLIGLFQDKMSKNLEWNSTTTKKNRMKKLEKYQLFSNRSNIYSFSSPFSIFSLSRARARIRMIFSPITFKKYFSSSCFRPV